MLEHIFIVFTLSILLLVNRKFGLSFLNPSLFLLSVWLFFYLAHWIIGQGLFISIESIIVVILMLISFNIGELIYLAVSKDRVNAIRVLKDDWITQKIIKRIIIVFSIISLLFSLLYARIFLQYLGGFAAYMVADIRSEVLDIAVPLWVRIPLLFSYSLLLISAIYYYKYDEIKYMLISALPILIMSIVQNGRAGTLMVVVIFFMAIIVRAIVKEHRSKKKTLVKYGTYIAIVGFVIFIGGALLRFRNAEIDGNSFFLDSFKSYLLGGVSAFDTYIHKPDTPSLGYGRYSFSSLYGLLGIAINEVGVYTNYLVFNSEGATTNIFTALRQMIDDFGFIGASVFMLILGFIGGKEWSKAKRGDHLALSFMLLFYMYLFHTPLLAVTVHNSILFSFFVPAILLKQFSKRVYLWKN